MFQVEAAYIEDVWYRIMSVYIYQLRVLVVIIKHLITNTSTGNTRRYSLVLDVTRN
jgi:hypothetical protein